jgi:hypothetical protein
MNCKNEPNVSQDRSATPTRHTGSKQRGCDGNSRHGGPGRQERNKLGPHREVGPQLLCALRHQSGVMFSACGPFWPWVTSKVTFWPSWSSRKPWVAMFE